MTVLSNGHCKCVTGRLFSWQPIVLGPPCIAFQPFLRTDGLKPVGRNDSKPVECKAKCLTNEFDGVQGANGGKNVGRVGG